MRDIYMAIYILCTHHIIIKYYIKICMRESLKKVSHRQLGKGECTDSKKDFKIEVTVPKKEEK